MIQQDVRMDKILMREWNTKELLKALQHADLIVNIEIIAKQWNFIMKSDIVLYAWEENGKVLTLVLLMLIVTYTVDQKW